MKKIICGEENVKAFQAELRQHLPGFHSLAKDLYQSGLIVGLRGATIEPIDKQSHQQNNIEPAAQEKTPCCAECEHWRRDKIGDGTGVGLCLLNIQPTILKWPGTNSCNKFEKIK